MKSWIDLHALVQIVVLGLLCGAGLPAVFALGLRALSSARHGRPMATGDTDRVVGGNPLAMAVAAACFALVLASIGCGIYLIVAAR